VDNVAISLVHMFGEGEPNIPSKLAADFGFQK
jgi:hypothetical protein